MISFFFDIASPPDRVFAALTDFEHLKDWRTLESVRVDPKGPARVGTRIHTTVKGPGQTMHFVNEVTELDPVARRYEDRWLEGTFLIESDWELELNGKGTRVRWTTIYQPRGIFRLIGPLLGRTIRQGQEKDMKTFASQLATR